MRFGVLGPVAAWADGDTAVVVPGVKVRALLADLLLHEGRPVPADRLIDDLWGDEPPGNPPGSLSAKVSQLRRAFEDAEAGARALVVARPAGYVLAVGPEAIDSLRFQDLVTRAHATADPRTRADLLAEGLALWRGPAFADFADEPFTRAAIASLEEQRLTAREEHAETRLELGEHTLLAGELTDLVAAHPLRERLRAAHMRALYRSGRQSEALASFEQLRAHLADELGLDPGTDIVALQRAVLAQDPALDAPAVSRPAPAARVASNLHAPLTELIGRDDAVAEVGGLLAADRLVTLVGPGGVGKTRLAIATAARAADGFADGVRMVELAAVDRGGTQDMAAALADVVMSVLDIHDTSAGGPVEPTRRLADALRARRMLLVLDNCEHIVEQVADLVEDLLRAAPDLYVLATSREPLAVAGEVVWDVPPLDVPAVPEPGDRAGNGADPATLRDSSAVRLFTARATAADRGFVLDAATAPAVAVLCRRLDGIPLALELAATRVRALGVHGLVERLDDRFRLLASGHRGRPPRQQTLTAMIDWSWELLTGPERIVLRRLAVHSDGCTPESAEAVCAGAGLAAADVPDLLARLVDRSLVTVVHDTAGAGAAPGTGTRYRLLESVAAYCLARMDDAGESAQVRLRHQRYHTELAETAEPHLRGPGQQQWLRRLTADAANLRAALDGSIADGHPDLALRLVCALTWFWFLRGRLSEAQRSLEAALRFADSVGNAGTGSVGDVGGEVGDVGRPALRARAAAWHAGISYLNGDATDWSVRRDTVLKLYDDLADSAGRARSEWFLAFAGSESGDLAVGDALLDRAMSTFRALDDRWGQAAVHMSRAKHAHVRGDLGALEREAESCAALFAEVGDGWGRLQGAMWLAGLAEMTGDLDRSTRLQHDGIRLAEELGLWTEVASGLSWLSWIALQSADYPLAREYCERSRRLAAEQGASSFSGLFTDIVLGFAARREGDLDLATSLLDGLLATTPREDTGAGLPLYLPLILTESGFVAELRGDAATARAMHNEAFAVARSLDAPRDRTLALEGLAGAMSLVAGHQESAALLLGAASTARTAHAMPTSPSEREDVARITARTSGAVGEAAFTAAFGRGAEMSPEQAWTSVEEEDGVPGSGH